jgi:hypothetical protein
MEAINKEQVDMASDDATSLEARSHVAAGHSAVQPVLTSTVLTATRRQSARPIQSTHERIPTYPQTTSHTHPLITHMATYHSKTAFTREFPHTTHVLLGRRSSLSTPPCRGHLRHGGHRSHPIRSRHTDKQTKREQTTEQTGS